MNNSQLVPDIILDLIEKYKNSKHDTELTNYKMRLEAINEAINNVLKTNIILKNSFKKK